MNNPRTEVVLSRRRTEWQFLKCLCVPGLAPQLRQECCAKLPAGEFADPAHQIVFEEIRALSNPGSARSASELREHLPTRITARGFPDLDFSDLLAAEDMLVQDPQTCLEGAYQRLLANR